MKSKNPNINESNKDAITIPGHVAIIMDGNRRWAKQRGISSAAGHKEGYEVFLKVMEFLFTQGVNTITVYAFSSENWQREKSEVDDILELLRYAFKVSGRKIIKEKLCFRHIGRKEDLPPDILKAIDILEQKTKENDRGKINVAFSYGGRAEIVDAVNSLISSGKKRITESDIEESLYTKGQEDPDLIIRTGGQFRLSNFLTWQSTYSELYFTDILWPDIKESDVKAALDFYAATKRNFGK